MTTGKFIRSVIIDIVVFIAIMIIVTAIASSISPSISNDMALAQMENSDDAYVMMNTYNQIRPLFVVIYVVITLGFTYTIIRDIYNYFKNEKEKN